MKSITVSCIAAVAAFATLTTFSRVAAQQIRYKPIILKTFGGPQSFVANNGTDDVKGAYLRVITKTSQATRLESFSLGRTFTDRLICPFLDTAKIQSGWLNGSSLRLSGMGWNSIAGKEYSIAAALLEGNLAYTD